MSRSCPGRHFADDLVWLSIATVLAVFDIVPAIDSKSGEPIMPKVEFESAVIRFVEIRLVNIIMKLSLTRASS